MATKRYPAEAMIEWHGIGALALVAAAMVSLGSRGNAAEAVPWVVQNRIEAVRAPGGIEVRCPVANPLNKAVRRRLMVGLADLEGNVLIEQSEAFTLSPGETICKLSLRRGVPPVDVPVRMIRYDLSGPGQPEKGGRALVEALAQLETRLVGYPDLLAGSRAGLRLVALNHATGDPVEGAVVVITLAGDSGAQVLYTGTTGADGSVDAGFEVPEDISGGADLQIKVSAQGLGEDELSQRVEVRRKSKVLLTTDKPLYQPGQTIEIRALSLRAADLKPDTAPLLFEVMDSKGNKVFKREVEGNAFGVSSAQFQLAREVNLGYYIVRATVGESTSEKQVTVDRYVLPKFKVEVKPDRAYYLPGDTLKGEVRSDYFFGKPVAGGQVYVTASKFEIGFEEFQRVEGRLDENGFWSFEIAVPRYFAGTPLEQGQASVRLQVEVVDTADHREEKVVMSPVAAAPLMLHAVPESGALVAGLPNQVFVLAAYPDGSPAAGATVHAEGLGLTGNEGIETDALGIANLTVAPEKVAGQLRLTLRAQDRQGRTAEKQVDLTGKEGLILRTDKTLCQVGETLHAEAIAAKAKGTVYFDLVREGQTVMTRTAEIEAGRAKLALDVNAGMMGSVALHAYMFTPGTDLVRDTRLLYVNPADALQVEIDLEQETYAPGEKAQLRFKVTNVAGDPTAAALGISIVDESVFALQEIHPGLEKVYFTLEKEIMKPRYEIHGYALDDIVLGPIMRPDGPAVGWSADQQKAARVLLASAEQAPGPPMRVNTFEEKKRAADQALQAAYHRSLEHIQKAVNQYLQKSKGKVPENFLGVLLRGQYLRPNDLLDPWGNRYALDFSRTEDQGGTFTMISAGPDGLMGTQDDIKLNAGGRWGGGRDLKRGRPMLGAVREEMAMPMAGAVPMPVPMAEAEMVDRLGFAEDIEAKSQPEGGPAPVRIREYFPETLLFEPALITNEQGAAILDVDLADSITTWRMTTMASSQGGLLGSQESPLRVFQDFFVDLDLPVALTQGDQVSIPVVVYNYLQKTQEVRLQFEQTGWFRLEGEAERTLSLNPGEVRSFYFPIEVSELGKHQLTVRAYGSQMSDAIRREIEVLPDGEEQEITFSDRLSGKVEHEIVFPPDAIEGAGTILVRVYPGTFSQIVDGLDSMLRMPSGCFEQTSAACYPNILIVQYMKATEQINPEIQMKAEGFINAGYQRLLAYEVDGGGFSWFGEAPANKVLTAWGLKEFYDMSKVHEVDPAVIDRTRAWLMGKQEPDGSWSPDESYLHAESWTGIQNSNVLVTAYITDAILNAGGQPSEVAKAIDYMKANWKDSKEAYTLALVANALVSWDKTDPWTQQVLEALYALREEDEEAAHWKGGSGTVTFTHGDAADIETTALAAIAFLNAGKYPETTTKALTHIIRTKSAQGHWGSTQATILALKALMTALGSRTEQVDGAVTVALNGEETSALQITPADCDVMRLVDLRDKMKPGKNSITLNLEGEGSMLYQVVGRFFTPWSGRVPEESPMRIEVAYDKTQLAVNDLATATVKVTNHRPAAAQMIIVDLGIPPGFQVMTSDLEALVEQKVIQKYEMTGRQVIIYFEEIGANATLEFSYKIRAKFPLRAQTPESRVYEYYNPEIGNAAAPEELTVE